MKTKKDLKFRTRGNFTDDVFLRMIFPGEKYAARNFLGGGVLCGKFSMREFSGRLYISGAVIA